MLTQCFLLDIVDTKAIRNLRSTARRTKRAHAISVLQPLLRLVLIWGLIVLGLSAGRLEVAAGGLPSPGSKPLATLYTCDEAGLDAAIAAGGTATFNVTPCVITLTATKTIAKDLTIDGSTTGGYGLILFSTGLRAFIVHTGVHFTLKNTSLYNATTTDANGGGAILVDGGSVMVDHDQLVNNTAGIGGAIRVINSGTLTVTQSTFLSNKATGGNGGAIDVLLGSTTILSTTFTSNTSSGIGGAVSSATPLTITASTFGNNSAPDGGAVVAIDTLQVTGSTFTANRATNGSGGGIATTSTLDVVSSTFTANHATNGAGGGIVAGGALDVASSAFISNTATSSGGAIIQNPSLSMNLESTSFTANHSDGDGGAVAAQGPLTVMSSTFTENTAKNSGGSILALFGPSRINSSTFTHNTSGAAGGAVAAVDTPLSVQNTAITHNTAPQGGGIYSVGFLTLTTSSLINNTSNVNGGALFTSPGAEMAIVSNTTIGQNTGNGIMSDGAGVWVVNSTIVNNDVALYASTSTMQLKNSIVGGECAGSIASHGYNLGTSTTCGLTQPTDRVLDYAGLKLGDLTTAGNGTDLYPVLAGSPARDTAYSFACPSTDQRGVARPQGSGCDIGAYEATAGVSLTPATTTLAGVASQTVTTTLTLTNVGPAVPDTYTLTVNGLGWSTTVQPTTTPLLAVGGSITLTIQVTIPPDAQPGQSSTITVTATSQTSPEQTATAQITTSVLPRQGMLPVVMRAAASGW